jgi:LSD1 subclass zinc finger protein
MPDSQVRKVACPSCGAPLLFGAGEITVRCTFCDAVVERPLAPGAPATIRSKPGTPPRSPSSSGGSPGGSGAALRRIMFLLGSAIILGAGVLGAVFLLRDIGPRFSLILNGQFIPYPVDRAEGPDFIGVAYDRNAGTYRLYRLDPVEGRVVWRGKEVKEISDVRSLAAGEGKFFAVEDTELYAYGAADGSELWQAELSDELNYCDECLSTAGDRVIVLTRDYVIEAFESQTGASAWKRRLDGYTSDFTIVDGELWLIDKEDGEESLLALDLADGSVRKRIDPVCREAGGRGESRLNSSSMFRFDPDPSVRAGDRSVYIYYGWFPGCIDRWDASSAALLWQAENDEGFSPSTNFATLFTPETVYFSYEETLWALPKDGGEVRILSEEGDYELVPLAFEQNVLILRTKRTRGTEQFGLRGIDPASGEILWDHPIKDSEPYDPPDAGFRHVDDDHALWTWKLSGGLLHLYLFQADPNQVSLSTLDPKDGAVASEEILAFHFSSDSYFGPDILFWKDNVLWVVADSMILAIDTSAAKILYRYP